MQKTALLVWEIGEALGHISSLRSIALGLKERGFRCVFALREISYAFSLLYAEGFEVFQAPLCGTQMSGPAPTATTANYAEVLMRFGFFDSEALAGQLLAWQSIARYIKPDLIILDSSPSASLAFKDCGVPTYCVSNGFGSPPDSEQWPAFPIHEKFPTERLRLSQAAVLSAANNASVKLGGSRIKHLGELYPSTRTFIASLPELDHYSRINGRYVGSLAMTNKGITPSWPVTAGKDELSPPKVFAYLKSNYKGLEIVLKDLCSLPIQTVAYVPGLSGASQKKWNNANLWISTDPLHVDQTLEQTNVVLCHGGGLVQSTLLRGRTLMLLPMQVEQSMMANQVTKLGVGLVCQVDGLSNFKKLMKRLVSEPDFNKKANLFADSNTLFQGTRPFVGMIDEMVKSVEP